MTRPSRLAWPGLQQKKPYLPGLWPADQMAQETTERCRHCRLLPQTHGQTVDMLSARLSQQWAASGLSCGLTDDGLSAPALQGKPCCQSLIESKHGSNCDVTGNGLRSNCFSSQGRLQGKPCCQSLMCKIDMRKEIYAVRHGRNPLSRSILIHVVTRPLVQAVDCSCV